MLTINDLKTQNTLPHISDISLKLYKDFSVNVLFDRKFHYYFNDYSEIILEFREWGIYHMLSIQHIDNRVGKNHFFEKIDNGLELDSFERNDAIKARYRHEKERITMFACLYQSLKDGQAFYIPSSKVPNTKNVEVEYIIFNIVGSKGMNIGLKRVANIYVPMTILVSRSINQRKYINETEYKLIRRLEILDGENHIIETKSYAMTII